MHLIKENASNESKGNDYVFQQLGRRPMPDLVYAPDVSGRAFTFPRSEYVERRLVGSPHGHRMADGTNLE